MSENNRLREVMIPNNYHQGINIWTKNIRVRNAIEGVVFSAAIFMAIRYFMAKILYVDVTEPWPVTVLISSVAIVFGISVVGINDDPITVYIYHCFQTFIKKRVTYYNPRIKYEATFYMKNNPSSFIQEDRRISILEKYKNQLLSKRRYTAQSELLEESLSTDYYFEDDENVVDKPIEYMTEKEKKHLNKINKKKKKIKWRERFKNVINRKNNTSKALKGK